MNDQMNSKHPWTRGENVAQTFEILMLLMIWTFLLILAYHASLSTERLWKALSLRRITLGYLTECCLLSLDSASGSFALTVRAHPNDRDPSSLLFEQGQPEL